MSSASYSRRELSPGSDELQVAILLWSGYYGGAETWSLALAHAMRERGIRPGLVIVGDSGPLLGSARRMGLPCESLRLRRGSSVLAHPVRLAAAATRGGSHAAITPSAGYLSASLRLGGYSGKILAVEHGTLLQLKSMSPARRAIRLVDWISGLWAVDAQVVPSDYMHAALLKVPHRRATSRIYLGIDPSSYPPPTRTAREPQLMVVGFAGRLIRGKGLDTLLHAVASATDRVDYIVEIAGDGPDRVALEDLTRRLGVRDRVRFRGWVEDIPAFWSECHVAVVPSNQWVESFGMVAIEAMAASLPVIASRRGALPEVVRNGVTGALFDVGDIGELSRLLIAYARDPDLRRRQGAAARQRCESEFSIGRCAQEYEQLIRSLMGVAHAA